MGIDPNKVHNLVNRHVGAWNSKIAEAVAATYSKDATFVINRGEPMVGRAEIAAMVEGFVSEFPDMTLTCDHTYIAGSHAIYVWTFDGHHKDTGISVSFQGWEEWEINDDLEVTASLGWYDEKQLSGR